MWRTRVRQEPLKGLDEEICFVSVVIPIEPFSDQATTEEDIMSGVDYGQVCHGHPEHQRPRHGGVLGLPTPPIEYSAAQGQALFGLGLSFGYVKIKLTISLCSYILLGFPGASWTGEIKAGSSCGSLA